MNERRRRKELISSPASSSPGCAYYSSDKNVKATDPKRWSFSNSLTPSVLTNLASSARFELKMV